MSLKIGIVGLPNVGKSTLFNALTKTKAAEAANYPFCTIDPNVGIVEVPDQRLHQLAELHKSEKKIPAAIEFVDIAGLVKGASEGEGLGNKFLSHIRQCNAIAHVVRIFDDPNISHVHGTIDPKSDREVIESELLLADLQTVEKRLAKAQADSKSGDKTKKAYLEIIQYVFDHLQQGKLAVEIDIDDEARKQLQDLHLLTAKENLYIINLPESEIGNVDTSRYAEMLGIENPEKIIPVCARVEEELLSFSEEEAREYLESLGLENTGLDHLIRSAYNTLGLMTFFTAGPKEARAWTVKQGVYAPQAAGTIHTDFETGFIKAEVVPWNHLVDAGSNTKAKEKGLLRMEGKEYLVKDGDVMLFRFNN